MKSILQFLVLVLFSSCLSDYEERTRIETVPSFSTIKLQSVFSVILKNDSEYKVTITGDDDVISEVELKTAGDTLLLINHAKGKLMNPERNTVVVEISAPSFRTFISEDSYSLRNVGTLTLDEFWIWNYPEVKISEITLDINTNFFFYWNNWLSGGKLTVSGNTEVAEIRNDALHIVDTRNLISNYTTVHHYGRETCEVNASTRLQYSLNGPGNIVVYGHPTEMVLIEKTSSGQLIVAD